VILNAKTVKGRDYYCVITSSRIENKPKEKMLLYLGRLDNLDQQKAKYLLERVRELGDPSVTLETQAILIRFGHAFPPTLDSLDLKAVRSYGPELALVRLAEEIRLVQIIDENSIKGGGPALGKMTLALAIYANRCPGSLLRFAEWYRRSSLPIFLDMPPQVVTYEATLNTLDYLQPERTRIIEAKTYSRVREVFHYQCERVDIDSTPVELSGALCRVLAKFGRAKAGGKSKRRQILITFLIDQKAALLGHEVFPGNRNDARTLKQVDKRLRECYDNEVAMASRVVDRGYASLANVRAMARKKEHFVVAARVGPKGLGLLKAIGVPQRQWLEIDDGMRAASLVKDKLKWVVTWNDEVAKRNCDGRIAKIQKAREALEILQKATKEGRIKSRAERDQKIGAILRKYGAKRFLKPSGNRKGFGFTIEETDKVEEKADEDGYQVFVTTELAMAEKEVVDWYRARDRIEKAIRTLKHCLGLGPIYVTTKKHVLGNIYLHALAYQLRAAMKIRLDEKKVEMSPEEAIWELERLQVAELIVRGNEIEVLRKLTKADGTVQTLIQAFSLSGEDGFPGLEEGI